MTDLKGFYNEDVLEELLFKNEISHLEFIYHHSQERIDDFKSYCTEKGIQEDERAAEAYESFRIKCEENSHVENLD